MQSSTKRAVMGSNPPFCMLMSSEAPTDSDITTPFRRLNSSIVPPVERKRCATISSSIDGETPRFRTPGAKHSYPTPFSKYPLEVGTSDNSFEHKKFQSYHG